MAKGRLQKHNVEKDGDCAYHSFANAVLDRMNTSGYDIDVPLGSLTVPVMQMTARDNARDFCCCQVGNNEGNYESADEVARIIRQECYEGEHGGINAINILAEHFGVIVDVYDKVGDHIQQIQKECTSLPLINLV